MQKCYLTYSSLLFPVQFSYGGQLFSSLSILEDGVKDCYGGQAFIMVAKHKSNCIFFIV
jgi:hypothetical protein